MTVPAADPRPVRWGVGDAVAGWLVANIAAVLIGGIIIGAAGYTAINTDHFPLWLIAILQVPLWFGYLGSVIWAGSRRGSNELAASTAAVLAMK